MKKRTQLTYDKVIDLWKTNRLIAAKLLTWVRNQQDGDKYFVVMTGMALNLCARIKL